MGMHRNPKSEEDLILDDKLDAARTMIRLRSRQTIRRDLNDIESRIVEAHSKELAAGEVTRLDLNPQSIVGELGKGADKK